MDMERYDRHRSGSQYQSTWDQRLAPPRNVHAYDTRSRSADGERARPRVLRSSRSTETFYGTRPERDIEYLSHLRIQARDCQIALDELARTNRTKQESFRVENARGLTFGEIANMADDQQFRVRAWVLEVRLSDTLYVASDGGETAATVMDAFKGLHDSTKELSMLCSNATPSDLEAISMSSDSGSDSEADWLSEPESSHPASRRQNPYALFLMAL
jgi:hypothetical protein